MAISFPRPCSLPARGSCELGRAERQPVRHLLLAPRSVSAVSLSKVGFIKPEGVVTLP